jgi:hypothetical protein
MKIIISGHYVGECESEVYEVNISEEPKAFCKSIIRTRKMADPSSSFLIQAFVNDVLVYTENVYPDSHEVDVLLDEVLELY